MYIHNIQILVNIYIENTHESAEGVEVIITAVKCHFPFILAQIRNLLDLMIFEGFVTFLSFHNELIFPSSRSLHCI